MSRVFLFFVGAVLFASIVGIAFHEGLHIINIWGSGGEVVNIGLSNHNKAITTYPSFNNPGVTAFYYKNLFFEEMLAHFFTYCFSIAVLLVLTYSIIPKKDRFTYFYVYGTPAYMGGVAIIYRGLI